MGLTQKLGTIPLAILTDSSNNVGIGAAANASFKLQVTGATNLTGALSGTSATFSGDVGVGTSSPSAKLNVSGISSGTSIRLDHTSSYSALLSYINGTNFIGLDNDSGTMILYAGSAERMRITSGGNVGIGTSSPFYGVDIASSDAVKAFLRITKTGGAQAFLQAFDDAAYCGTITSHPLIISTNSTEKMRITSGGNVVIGGTTAQNNATNRGNLTINGTTSILNLSISDTNGGYLYHGGTDMLLVNAKNGAQLFYTNDTEQMRITSGGDVGIGMSGVDLSRLTTRGKDSTSTNYAFIAQNSATTNLFLVRNDNVVIVGSLGTGTVYSNGGVLTNTNPSDLRLKDNITDISYGLNEILQLRPVSYHWKDDKINQGVQFGFIAQEVQEVMPEAIKEFGDDVKYLGLEKDAIYATLVKAIQEQQAQIEELRQIVATK